MIRSYMPPWRDEVPATEAWWRLIEEYIAAGYSGYIHEYDVIREMWQHGEWRQQNVRLFLGLSDPASIGYHGHCCTDRPSFRDGNAMAGPNTYGMSAVK